MKVYREKIDNKNRKKIDNKNMRIHVEMKKKQRE